MADKSGKANTDKQKFLVDSPVINLTESIDFILNKLGIDESSCRNPSCRNDSGEKIAGLTNTYLKHTRIGRKLSLGKADLFYGRKFNLLPSAYEMVSYDAPTDVFAFIESRIRETLTDYMSIHRGNFRLNLDIRDGIITDLVKMGFDEQFTCLSKDAPLLLGDLIKVIKSLNET